MARTTRQKFEAAQQAYREASLAEDELEIALGAKYGRRDVQWASTSEKRKLEQLRNRRDRACDRVFKMVLGAPRDWGVGVPVHWVCGSLSYDDAFRPASESLSVTPPLAYGATEPMRGNPEVYQDNQLGGAGIALLAVGAAAVLGWLVFARRSPIAPAAAATPATCPIDFQKLDRWGAARGFGILYLPRTSTPLTVEEFFAHPQAPVITTGQQAVTVLSDGSFWYYLITGIGDEGVETGRADNLRADYCAFEG